MSSVAGRTGAVVLANTDISGLGNASTKNVGTAAGTVAAGDDARFGTASTFTGSFTGDVTGTQSATVVSAVGGSTATNVHNAELLANSATNANTVSTIVRRDANGDFISRDASLRSVILRDSGSKNITMVAPATLTNNYTLTWPTDKGTLNQVLTTDASGNLSWGTPASSGVSTVTSGGAPIVIGGSGSAPTVSVNAATDSTSGVVTLAADGGITASTVVQATDARLTNARTPSGNAGGDLSSTYPNPTVSGLKGAAITYTSLTTGDFLKYNGTAWVNTALSSANLSNDGNLLKTTQMPSNCSASQALTFSSPTGTWVCSTIAGLDAGVITTGTIADNRLPASATYWQAATGGINYAGGNVGIGTTTPTQVLDIERNTGLAQLIKNTGDTGTAKTIFTNTLGSTHIGRAVTVAGVSGSAFEIADGVTSRFYIDQAGNVGIGTTTPATALDVKGNITLQGATSGSIALGAPATGASGTLTLPPATDTLVARNSTDTLTNKTLSAPVLNGGVEAVSTQTMASSTTAALDFQNNSNFIINAAGLNITGFVVSNIPATLTAGTLLSFTIQLNQTSSLGTVTWTASGYSFAWGGGSPPTLVASKNNVVACWINGGTTVINCNWINSF